MPKCKRFCVLVMTWLLVVVSLNQVLFVGATSNKTVEEKISQIFNSNINNGDYIMYDEYIKSYEGIKSPKDCILLDAEKTPYFNRNDIRSEINYQEDNGVSFLLENDSDISWKFNVTEEGLYALNFYYYPVSGYGEDIERRIILDNKVPFYEADSLKFDKVWSNKDTKKTYDTQGNEILVQQIEAPMWLQQFARDESGFVDTPLYFYFSKGEHSLTVAGVSGAMLLKSVTLTPINNTKSLKYEDYIKNLEDAKNVSEDVEIVLQGENAEHKSSQMIHPLADRTSPSVEPSKASNIVYNTIGGSQWSNANQWIEWKFYAPETGLYGISSHFKQSLKESRASIRKITIDGETPFVEANNWMFNYDNAWQLEWFKSSNNEPYKIYIEKGWHTLRLTVGYGNYNSLLFTAKNYLVELNTIYREITVVTGVQPDINRDYHFDKTMPETLNKIEIMSQKLRDLEVLFGKEDGTGNSTPDIKRIYEQMDIMCQDDRKIASMLTSFKDNIASYGTWINSQMGQTLELDWVRLSSLNNNPKIKEDGFFSNVLYYVKQFICSFVTDYAKIGETSGHASKSVKVWMTLGQDQSQILRRLISSDFTPQKEITVDLQMVSATALLPSVLAKKGPDVILNLTQDMPLNLALRNAAADLNQFKDIDTVLKEFYKYSYVPFEWNGGLYALPETQTWPMLFYRKDIIKDLGISISEFETWDKLLGSALPKLQKNSLMFGITPSVNTFLMFAYQNGAEMYNEDGSVCNLNSAEAIESMKRYTMLYSHYGLQLSYDFANRFRNGEMPVAIADFTQYNVLSMFAPEIKDLWCMIPVPGTVTSSGNISHKTVSTVTGSLILSSAKDKNAAWEFLKWWVSGKTQADFGVELESVVGSAARYNTANKVAMKEIKWDPDMVDNLMLQAEILEPYREVPGGYFTTRLFDFAFRKIVYDKDDVRECMNQTIFDINKELTNKRKEYNLD